jgi:hypothetical protein
MTAEALSKNKLGSAVDWLRICNDPKMSSNCSDEYVRTIQLSVQNLNSFSLFDLTISQEADRVLRARGGLHLRS